ncbi:MULTISPECIES: alpha/beta hydrolase [unclassified Rhodococcus (in: high G+C Gram-positive bacteria)]|uniref:alpha/beta hydrolase n=1 Tax=unclassified Rhodococcus (in: high G+C Gram-positive bacteria) TaxID=192944 RepID=UPI00163AA69A|nr:MULTISPECIES: alpha/beta fold hydrolase [unclassified Rhodococcus (in: high G+C Gram-positive bacteria)]MBC2640931.1 alpha/beta fold hydrolase [Rhodococcus sp. 3A]MBC2894326.1 alpha/beta fold hydrolase [Rhodococcus sp. 4CII]
MIRVVLIAVALVALLIAAAWVLQRKLIYYPDTTPAPPAGRLIAGAEDVTLTTSDGLELGAWYVPPAVVGEPRMTVLVAAGNAGNRADRALLASDLAAAGFATMLFDYRGYGGNPGHPSEEGLALDVRAARRYLVDERRVPPERLLYFGESLGTGVVTELATEHPPAGLLLRSPFVDLAAVGGHHYPFLPVGLLLRDQFPVAEHVAHIDVPITVVYGTADTVVPPEQSARVAESALGDVDTVVLVGAGHNDDVMFGGQEIVRAIVDLAARALRAP